jgi:hypothetical protein
MPKTYPAAYRHAMIAVRADGPLNVDSITREILFQTPGIESRTEAYGLARLFLSEALADGSIELYEMVSPDPDDKPSYIAKDESAPIYRLAD